MPLYRIVMEAHRKEHTVIKFCFKSEMNGADMNNMMKMVYSDTCPARSNAFEWFGWFWEGCESVEDETRVGCLHTSQTVNNIEHVRAALKTDQRMSIRMLADDSNIDKETIQQIIMENLEKKGMCSFLVMRD